MEPIPEVYRLRDALDKLQIRRICCRRMILVHVELVDNLLECHQNRRRSPTPPDPVPPPISSPPCERLLQEKKPILLVGESPTRGLSLALAILRGSFRDIWSSSLNTTEQWTLKELVRKVDALHVPECAAEDINDLEESAKTCPWQGQLFLQADATKLQDAFGGDARLPTANIWFQCPWVLPSDEKQSGYETAKLLMLFVTSASRIQAVGDFLLIGLLSVAAKKYYDSYEFDNLQHHALSLGYEYRCADNVLIRKCVDYGYRLWTDAKDKADVLHEYSRDKHVTHVFEKIRKDPSDDAVNDLSNGLNALRLRK